MVNIKSKKQVLQNPAEINVQNEEAVARMSLREYNMALEKHKAA
jgi:hypothetical protein